MFRNVAWWKGLKEGETASQSLLSDEELDENFEKVVEWRMSDHDANIFLDMTRMDKMITAVHGAIFGGFGFYASSRMFIYPYLLLILITTCRCPLFAAMENCFYCAYYISWA